MSNLATNIVLCLEGTKINVIQLHGHWCTPAGSVWLHISIGVSRSVFVYETLNSCLKCHWNTIQYRILERPCSHSTSSPAAVCWNGGFQSADRRRAHREMHGCRELLPRRYRRTLSGFPWDRCNHTMSLNWRVGPHANYDTFSNTIDDNRCVCAKLMITEMIEHRQNAIGERFCSRPFNRGEPSSSFSPTANRNVPRMIQWARCAWHGCLSREACQS